MSELGFEPQEEMELYSDNKAALDMSHNPIQHDRTKHVEVDRHFIKEKVDSKILKLLFVKSESQLADILTKGVSSKFFESTLDKLGMTDVYVPA